MREKEWRKRQRGKEKEDTTAQFCVALLASSCAKSRVPMMAKVVYVALSDLSSCTAWTKRERKRKRTPDRDSKGKRKQKEREADFTEVAGPYLVCSSSILERMFDQSIHSARHTYTDRKRKKGRKREILQQRLLSPLLRLLHTVTGTLKWLWRDEPLIPAVTAAGHGTKRVQRGWRRQRESRECEGDGEKIKG